MKFFKGLLAVLCVLFFLALGAFGGCLAGVATDSSSVNLAVVGLVGGGIAGIWIGVLVARKIL